MNLKNIDIAIDQLNAIERLYGWFDILSSPIIEENGCSSLDCCIGNDMPRDIKYVIEIYGADYILGAAELTALCQLNEMLSKIIDYDNGKGFSKTQRWLDFVTLVNTVDALLKDAVKRYKDYQKQDEEEKYLDATNHLLVVLDFFTSSNIEEKMIFSLEYYRQGAISYMKNLNPHLGSTSWISLWDLNDMLYDVYRYDNEKGFSKKQRWIDCVDFINTVNILLKNEIKRYGAITGYVTTQGYAISLENMHKELRINLIRRLCKELDLIVSPDIEEEAEGDLDYHVNIPAVQAITRCLTERCVDETQSIIGDTELTVLPELEKALRELHHSCWSKEEEGYPRRVFKEQAWIDLVGFANIVNNLLKDAVKRYKATTEKT